MSQYRYDSSLNACQSKCMKESDVRPRWYYLHAGGEGRKRQREREKERERVRERDSALYRLCRSSSLDRGVDYGSDSGKAARKPNRSYKFKQGSSQIKIDSATAIAARVFTFRIMMGDVCVKCSFGIPHMHCAS